MRLIVEHQDGHMRVRERQLLCRDSIRPDDGRWSVPDALYAVT
jgi:hypothetical protein